MRKAKWWRLDAAVFWNYVAEDEGLVDLPFQDLAARGRSQWLTTAREFAACRAKLEYSFERHLACGHVQLGAAKEGGSKVSLLQS